MNLSPLFNNLMEFNPETPDFNDLRCDLCTSWELAADGKTYTFHINPDAHWWDGVPVTSDHIVFIIDAQIDPNLLEAGVAAGCTKRQLLWRIKLPLALPEIMLGINQTIMLALSMLVITALVGTRDLGQEVYIALTKADTGRGIVAGLSVAFIAIIADRLIAAGSDRMRRRLGLATNRASA